ncbi:MAG: hypothetical protein WD767_02110 [Alphaproteobacteria bacterium]
MTTDALKFNLGRRRIALNPYVVYAAVVGVSLGIMTALIVLSLTV